MQTWNKIRLNRIGINREHAVWLAEFFNDIFVTAWTILETDAICLEITN